MNTGLYQLSINSHSLPFPFRSTRNSEKLPQKTIITNAFKLNLYKKSEFFRKIFERYTPIINIKPSINE
jgi:hypothetical protein